jgi:GH24 family phage-related lysozyme (muramidase)
MRESSTIQAFLEEGRVKGLAEEARRIIMLQGNSRQIFSA